MDARREAELIVAARGGDEGAFRQLVMAHRASLRAHCYRMLGSVSDADDALQETLVAAWQGLAGFEGRSALRSWLFTIATHACLRSASRRRITPDERSEHWPPRVELPPLLTEIAWLGPYPGAAEELSVEPSPEARYSERESVELAFVAAVQVLPATQRAVVMLRDVLGFTASETAEALATSAASVNSALQRARETLAERAQQPEASQAANRRALGEAAERRLVESFLEAWRRADVAALVALLAEDATFTMPPLPCWFRGRSDIGVFFAERVFAQRWRFVPALANGQPAIAAYSWEEGSYRFDVLNVLDLRGDRVSRISSFLLLPAEQLGLAASVDD